VTTHLFCSACGKPLGADVRFCPSCGQAVIASNSTANTTPSRSQPSGMSFELKVALLGVIAIIFAAIVLSSSPNGHSGSNSEAVGNRQTQESSLTEADQLIENCGKPLKDDSTAYDSPRPPIVTRFVDYKVNGIRLKFIYVPGNGHVGDPPPYDWKLQMVANAKTNKLYDRDQMSKLMGCTASLPGPRLVAGQSPRTDTTN
jgi:hypothetical protein